MRTLVTPRKPGELAYRDLLYLVQNHHRPKPSEIVQHFKFHSHFVSLVTIAKFVAKLHQLSEHCEFGTDLEDMHDHLVCDNNDNVIQHRLLEKSLHARYIQKANSTAQSNVFYATKAIKGKTVECYRCGGAHLANSCKFKDTECHKCGKKRHLGRNAGVTNQK